jgi:PAS domain S-box-containing protein
VEGPQNFVATPDLCRTLIETAQEGVWLLDAAGNTAYVNQRMAEMLGYTRAEMLGRPFYDFMDDRARAEARVLFERRRQGVREQHDFRFQRKDGSDLWTIVSTTPLYDEHSQFIGALGMITDITARRQAEEALRASQHQLHQIIEHLPVAVFAVDGEGKPRYENRLARELLGKRIEDLNGDARVGRLSRYYQAYLAGTDQFYPIDRAPLAQALAGKCTTVDDMEIRRPDRTIPLEVSAAPITDAAGNVVLAIAVFRDISERRQTEAERQRLFDEVQANQQRLRALSQRLLELQEAERGHLARELHDEIGQALTAVKINVQAAQRQATLEEAAPLLADSIDLVERVLQQVRDISLNLRPALLDDLGLAAALRWYVDRQTRRAGIVARVVTDLLDEPLPDGLAITCFRVVQEALTNILRHAQARHVNILVAHQGQELILTVSDDGCGFDADATFHSAADHATFGLLSMQERVELAGGRLTIRSTPGEGTEVRVALPLHGGRKRTREGRLR